MSVNEWADIERAEKVIFSPVLAVGSVHLGSLPHSCTSPWHDEPSWTLKAREAHTTVAQGSSTLWNLIQLVYTVSSDQGGGGEEGGGRRGSRGEE